MSLLTKGQLVAGNSKAWLGTSTIKELSLAGHTHSEYAAVNHRHSGYAAANHTHSQYASNSHNHSANNITSGTLPINRGGTGVTTLGALKSLLGLTETSSGCKIDYIEYVGDGQNSHTKTFSVIPIIVIFTGDGSNYGSGSGSHYRGAGIVMWGGTNIISPDSTDYGCSIGNTSFSDKSITITVQGFTYNSSLSSIFNEYGKNYIAIAIGV